MSIQDLIILRGRAASDVVLHRSDDPDGRSFGRFRMAVPRARRRDDGQWEEAEPSWYTVKAWGGLAENLGYSVRRGAPVLVVGRPVPQAWINKAGEAQADMAVHAVSAGLDLVFGISSFARLQRQSVDTEEEPTEDEYAAVSSDSGAGYGEGLPAGPAREDDSTKGDESEDEEDDEEVDAAA